MNSTENTADNADKFGIGKYSHEHDRKLALRHFFPDCVNHSYPGFYNSVSIVRRAHIGYAQYMVGKFASENGIDDTIANHQPLIEVGWTSKSINQKGLKNVIKKAVDGYNTTKGQSVIPDTRKIGGKRDNVVHKGGRSKMIPFDSLILVAIQKHLFLTQSVDLLTLSEFNCLAQSAGSTASPIKDYTRTQMNKFFKNNANHVCQDPQLYKTRIAEGLYRCVVSAEESLIVVHDSSVAAYFNGIGVLHDSSVAAYDGVDNEHDSSAYFNVEHHDSFVAAHDGVGVLHDSSVAAYDGIGVLHDSSVAAYDCIGVLHDSSVAAHDSVGGVAACVNSVLMMVEDDETVEVVGLINCEPVGHKRIRTSLIGGELTQYKCRQQEVQSVTENKETMIVPGFKLVSGDSQCDDVDVDFAKKYGGCRTSDRILELSDKKDSIISKAYVPFLKQLPAQKPLIIGGYVAVPPAESLNFLPNERTAFIINEEQEYYGISSWSMDSFFKNNCSGGSSSSCLIEYVVNSDDELELPLNAIKMCNKMPSLCELEVTPTDNNNSLLNKALVFSDLSEKMAQVMQHRRYKRELEEKFAAVMLLEMVSEPAALNGNLQVQNVHTTGGIVPHDDAWCLKWQINAARRMEGYQHIVDRRQTKLSENFSVRPLGLSTSTGMFELGPISMGTVLTEPPRWTLRYRLPGQAVEVLQHSELVFNHLGDEYYLVSSTEYDINLLEIKYIKFGDQPEMSVHAGLNIHFILFMRYTDDYSKPSLLLRGASVSNSKMCAGVEYSNGASVRLNVMPSIVHTAVGEEEYGNIVRTMLKKYWGPPLVLESNCTVVYISTPDPKNACATAGGEEIHSFTMGFEETQPSAVGCQVQCLARSLEVV